MTGRITLSDDVLGDVVSALATASEAMTDGNGEPPRAELPSLTGIGDDVAAFLSGVEAAGLALADAGRGAGRAVADAMESSTALDRRIAESLSAGHPGG